MKRILLFIVASLLIFFGIVYGLLFTPAGNSFVASKIEDKANEDPRANFKVDEFVLTPSSIKFMATVDENSTIKVKGGLELFSKRANLNYEINVKDLSKLQKFTNQKLNGAFSTKGSVKGDQELMVIKGESTIFDSDTTYKVELKQLKPSDINFLVKNAKIEKLLFMVNQPIYATGLLNVDGKIKNAQLPTLDGVILTKVANGKVNNAEVNKAFNQKLVKPLNFKGDVVTNLNENKALSKVDFYTTMANIFVKEALVNLENGLIKSDYLVKVPDLSKLYDVSQMKMRGAIDLNGDLKKYKEDLTVTGLSKLLGGDLNFKLHNNDFNAKINGVEIKDLTYMMYYPRFFTSKANVNIDYNILKQVGKVDGKLINGQFLPNQYSKVINTFAKFDLTKEVYESVDVKSDIDKKVLQSTVDMKSKLTQIKVTKSTVDLNKSTIDALVRTNLKGIEFDTLVKGALASPKIKVDTKQLAKAKLKETFKKKIEEKTKKIEEKIQEKIGDETGIKSREEIIEGFKQFFGN